MGRVHHALHREDSGGEKSKRRQPRADRDATSVAAALSCHFRRGGLNPSLGPPRSVFLQSQCAPRRWLASAAWDPWSGSAEEPANRRRRGRRQRVPIGSNLITAASMSAVVSPGNARRPASISNSTAPNAQMSARRSTACPWPAPEPCRPPCRGSSRLASPPRSGWANSRIAGGAAESSAAFAKPKSSTFTVPSGVTFTFAGFRSRWMMPFSCAYSRASAICLAMRRASSSGGALSGWPSDAQIGQGEACPYAESAPPASAPPPAPSPGRDAAGFFQAVDRRDIGMIERGQHLRFALESRHALGVAGEASGRTLSATSRFSLVSRARYTSPIPPAPSGETIS